MTRAAVIRFPGSNCETETGRALEAAGIATTFVWHREADIRGVDLVVLPGGFSYGDYLRSGAIARFSPVMEAVRQHAAGGGAVFGICNGFQILCETGLLPGALMRNAGLTFVSRPIRVRVERTTTPFTSAYEEGAELVLPVAHGEGRFEASEEVRRQLEAEHCVVLRYVPGDNPNGSTADIAGISNAAGNIVGIMPHPERVAEAALGSSDGAGFFRSVASWTRVLKGVA
ncbi:MAG TPA: phosphoribosylformylglycinamidine synthase subunit PurQ [Gemmatimonadales bacterium]|nr:phosphoribosylformylglycinamidine synthase subunit PurQ [Gemmatimonadales bacterium]